IPKTAIVLLEFFIKRESKVSLLRDPLSHFCQEEVVLHAQECLLKLNKQVINFQDVRDMVENLVALHNMCIKKNPDVAKTLGLTVRKLTIIVGEVAGNLEKLAEVPVTDWMAIGDAIVSKLEQMNLPKQPPYTTFIPKMRDFKSLKMLGAGGFGAVYLANYKPANFVATIKLVAMDRFSKHKQAAMDKVVASVVRNPFLVKYYSCFCVKEAYVTIMEYIAGLDLMRVVTMEGYLEIDAVQVIMAQLILAVEHMHLRGFLHRDIKVSKASLANLKSVQYGGGSHRKNGVASIPKPTVPTVRRSKLLLCDSPEEAEITRVVT
ncbi:serine/threonine protein kinase, putative, partial [Ixodes scapularis]